MEDHNDFELVRVSADSDVKKVAGAMAGMYRERGEAVAQAIGAAAVNQMVKAAAVAISYLADDRLIMACVPSFVTVEVEGRAVTAMRLQLVDRDDPVNG